jgi:hypothetical protein
VRRLGGGTEAPFLPEVQSRRSPSGEAVNLLVVGLVVFLAATAYDLAFARYVQAASGGKPFRAASWSVTVYVIGLIGLIGVLNVSHWMILPECLGLFVGTSIGVSVSRPVD